MSNKPLENIKKAAGVIIIYFIASMIICMVVFGLMKAVSLGYDKVSEKYQREKEADNQRLCAYYGNEINAHYGKDICEDQKVYLSQIQQKGNDHAK